MFSRKMNGVQRLHIVDKNRAAVMRPIKMYLNTVEPL